MIRNYVSLPSQTPLAVIEFIIYKMKIRDVPPKGLNIMYIGSLIIDEIECRPNDSMMKDEKRQFQ